MVLRNLEYVGLYFVLAWREIDRSSNSMEHVFVLNVKDLSPKLLAQLFIFFLDME